MKNFRKKQPPEARFGFYGKCAPDKSGERFVFESFSLGVFELIPFRSRSTYAKGPIVCRIEAKNGQSLEDAKRTAELVCQVLEAGVTLPKARYKAGADSDELLHDLLLKAAAKELRA